MASQDDFLTTQKNFVSAMNGFSDSNFTLAGKANSGEITTTTAVSSKAGYFVGVSVIVAGSGTATVYDSTSVSNPTNRIAIISPSVGLSRWDIPVANGIVIAPGTGMTVNVIYS
jgi:hypothetical protein